MIITQTPLRVSLLGGNTDFPKYFKKHGGVVLTTTIDKYIYCIVKKRFDSEIWINYSIKEKVKNVDNIKHDLVREAMRLVWKDSKEPQEGIEITFLSDIPSEGSGLGSSSAVTVGVLNALYNYKNELVTSRRLAEEACNIEIDILKKPIGMQDQYAVAFGGLNLIQFGDKIKINPIDPTNSKVKDLMLFYTGKTRNSNRILSKMKFRKTILDRNKELAYMGRINIAAKQSMGHLLDEYWALKKALNKSVSNNFINDLYIRACNFGAFGGKIVGAGGGGFLLLEVPPEFQEGVRDELCLQELPFRLSKYGSRVIFNINE